MKKATHLSIILLCALSFFALDAKAQDQAQNETVIGGGLVYGSGIEQPGIQVKYYRPLPDALDNKLLVGGNITVFFPDKFTAFGVEGSTQLITINSDGRFLFKQTDNYDLYGLAGLNISFIGTEIEGIGGFNTTSRSSLGVSFGGGGSLKVGFAQLNAELRYVANDFDQIELSAGLQIPIN